MSIIIEYYLNSLPLDTTEINVSEKGLTYLPDLSRFKQLTHLYCSYNQLTELPPLNDKLKSLYCSKINTKIENIFATIYKAFKE